MVQYDYVVRIEYDIWYPDIRVLRYWSLTLPRRLRSQFVLHDGTDHLDRQLVDGVPGSLGPILAAMSLL
jgi:hypothetical protein